MRPIKNLLRTILFVGITSFIAGCLPVAEEKCPAKQELLELSFEEKMLLYNLRIDEINHYLNYKEKLRYYASINELDRMEAYNDSCRMSLYAWVRISDKIRENK